MNIISKILLAGYDISLESASWAEVMDQFSPEAQELIHFKLIIKKHNGDDLVLGAISPERLKAPNGDAMIRASLIEMFKLLEKD